MCNIKVSMQLKGLNTKQRIVMHCLVFYNIGLQENVYKSYGQVVEKKIK
jgi:hypothetical protein